MGLPVVQRAAKWRQRLADKAAGKRASTRTLPRKPATLPHQRIDQVLRTSSPIIDDNDTERHSQPSVLSPAETHGARFLWLEKFHNWRSKRNARDIDPTLPTSGLSSIQAPVVA